MVSERLGGLVYLFVLPIPGRSAGLSFRALLRVAEPRLAGVRTPPRGDPGRPKQVLYMVFGTLTRPWLGMRLVEFPEPKPGGCLVRSVKLNVYVRTALKF